MTTLTVQTDSKTYPVMQELLTRMNIEYRTSGPEQDTDILSDTERDGLPPQWATDLEKGGRSIWRTWMRDPSPLRASNPDENIPARWMKDVTALFQYALGIVRKQIDYWKNQEALILAIEAGNKKGTFTRGHGYEKKTFKI